MFVLSRVSTVKYIQKKLRIFIFGQSLRCTVLLRCVISLFVFVAAVAQSLVLVSAVDLHLRHRERSRAPA